MEPDEGRRGGTVRRIRAPRGAAPGRSAGRALRAAGRVWLIAVLAIASASAQAGALVIGGTGAGLGILSRLADAYRDQHPDAEIEVLPSLGSSGGIRALLAGKLQLAVSARPAKDKEREAGAESEEFARTPYVFAVAQTRPPDGMTLERVVAIYSGEIDRWEDGQRVRVILRPASDSDTALLRALSPAMARALDMAAARRGMRITLSDQKHQESLESIPGAFGATSLGQMRAESRALKALALDGVMPSLATLRDGRYPLVKHLYLVSGPASDDTARSFLAFIRSPRGREVLTRYGYWAP